MIEHADISVARSGDILIITDSEEVEGLSSVAYSIRSRSLWLHHGNTILARIPLSDDDLRCFERTREVSFLNVRDNGEQELFVDIRRLEL